MKRKKLTRIQAWRFIQKKFQNAIKRNTVGIPGYTYYGLCYVVRLIKRRGLVSDLVGGRMREEIRRYGSRRGMGTSQFFWPTDVYGAVGRIAAIDKILKRKVKK